ncbi:MAG: RNA polymerase sigma factor [Pseudomonadota bacterium]
MDDSAALFEQVTRPHFDRLYRLAWRLTGGRVEAEDLFQEVLIKAYAKLDHLVDIDQPGAWLARVMTNLFIDQQRRFKRQRLGTVAEGELHGDGFASIAGDLDPVADKVRYDRLRRLDTALQQLSDDHRLVVLLHDTEGYTLEEIHAMTGTPVGTCKSRLHRARQRLKEILLADGTFS